MKTQYPRLTVLSVTHAFSQGKIIQEFFWKQLLTLYNITLMATLECIFGLSKLTQIFPDFWTILVFPIFHDFKSDVINNFVVKLFLISSLFPQDVFKLKMAFLTLKVSNSMPSLRLLVDNALQNVCTCPHAHQQCVRVACAFVKLMY